MSTKWYDLIMGDENRVENPLIVVEQDFFGFDADDLWLGRRAMNWNAQAQIRSDSPKSDGTPDDLLANALGVPIMSARLRSALAGAGIATEDIQFLPVRIFKSSGEELRGFEIANIVTRVPVLNREHSTMLDVDEEEIDPLTNLPKVRSVWTAALNGGPLAGHDVIRLTEFFPAIFVSERFAEVFRSGCFTGATLKRVQVY